MDLSEINKVILGSLSKLLNIKTPSSISTELVTCIISKLSGGGNKSGKLEDLFHLLQTLGIEISHINLQKVAAKDDLHSYLLLDFLNLLLETLFSDNPQAFSQLIHSLDQESIRRRGGDFSLSSSSEPEFGGATTSGGEEVVRILAEARRKYGRIRSFREKIDAENISLIQKPKPAEHHVSEVDHAPVDNVTSRTQFPPHKIRELNNPPKIRESKMTLKLQKLHQSKFSSSITLSSYSSSSSSRGSRSTSISTSSTVDNVNAGIRKQRLKKNTKEELKELDENDRDGNEENEVNVRIPLEEASINVKIRSDTAGVSLKNRRIHIRLQEAVSPKRSKKVVYGSSSVLFHHHRKSRPPMFSKKMVTPRLDDKEVLSKAVQVIKKRKRDEKEVEDRKENEKKAKTRENVKLETQKYLREIRTRNGQLKKLASEIKK